LATEGNAGCRRGPGPRVIPAAISTLLISVVSLTAVPASSGESGGGAMAPGVPSARDVICERGCVGLRSPTVGGVVQVSGRNLSRVTRVSFPGLEKRVVVEVVKTSETSATAVVPEGAQDGKVKVRDDYGNASALTPTALDIRPASELGEAGQLELAEAQTSPRKAYFFGMKAPQLDYVISSSEPRNDLRIDVVSASGDIARSFFRNDVEANTTQTIRWNGRDSSGKVARGGAYRFVIRSQAGNRAARSSSIAGGALGFRLYSHIFPVRGRHTYGDGIGAPRSGHTHQGVDVFATCGTRMVAARGGEVQYNGYHGAAGHYLVIDGRNTGVDYVYMHMTGPSPRRLGSTVKTGQFIGYVGESGNASGCHLHYEMWSAPGWYEGGSFLDPVPFLKRWDRHS
jgi:murein DD-endopeptidase MepM/ murein hydrolase activator NlpD